MFKTVYIIRHGEVDEKTDALGRLLIHPPNAKLSESGKQDMNQLASHLQEHFITLDAIYTSPSVRMRSIAV